MNGLFVSLGWEGWKPVLTALCLPPVPLLMLVVLGAVLLQRRRDASGWLILLAALAGLWLSSTTVFGQWLQRTWLRPPPALGAQDVQQLRATARDGSPGTTAILVLGAGREAYAPEYRGPNLTALSLERLRYGLWLARETGQPVAFSGGTGHAQGPGPAEAEVAALIAARDFSQPLKWTESASRDTRENAERSVTLLRAAGVDRIVLVTHGWHMRRSLRAFELAITRRGGGMVVVAAPLGLAGDGANDALDWLPTLAGIALTRHALREGLGLLAGA